MISQELLPPSFLTPCQSNNLKPSLVQYIYPISYKIAKKANPRKWICPIKKKSSDQFR